MRITNRDKSNLARFGCAFWPKEKLIYVSLAKERKNQALSANIVARLICNQCASGPLLSLAFEISPTRVLPHYSFFPFDLKNGIHRNYLSSIFKSRQIRLLLVADSHQIARTYQIGPRRCQRMTELYATAIADLEKFPAERYDFDRAVNELEQSIRIVDSFAYALPETEIRRLMLSSRAEAETVSADDRAQAAQTARKFLEVFRSRYDNFLRGYAEQLPYYSRVLLLLADLRNYFEGDYEAAVQFATDLVATHTPKEDNRQLEALAQLAELAFKTFEQVREMSSGAEKTSDAERQAVFQEIMRRVASQGMSLRALQNILSIFGIQLGGRPGRPRKDYSVEYELRAARKKWREVVEYNLQNDPETRAEFGGRKFDELSREQRSTLIHRVREGVRGYAKRTRKPFPPQKEN